MNKRDREQFRASIAKDLVQGEGEHSPTKELLKQYAPLEGIITTPVPDVSPRPGVTGRINLPVRKHNFATEPSISLSFATQAPGTAIAWEAYLCQKF
jgi:hypothetical protein